MKIVEYEGGLGSSAEMRREREDTTKSRRHDVTAGREDIKAIEDGNRVTKMLHISAGNESTSSARVKENMRSRGLSTVGEGNVGGNVYTKEFSTVGPACQVGSQ